MFVQRWKWMRAKKSREVWFDSWRLRVLRRTIKSKRPGILSDRIILLHDNVRPHTVNLVRDKVQRFYWKTRQHPPYNPDLFPCNFLKKDIRGRRCHSDEELQVWVRLWIHQRSISFYRIGIDRLVSQWDNCASCGSCN